jgi:hypothetical protein
VEGLLLSVTNVQRASDVRQKEVHTAESPVLEPSPFEVQIAIGIFRKYKSPGIDHTQAELV